MAILIVHLLFIRVLEGLAITAVSASHKQQNQQLRTKYAGLCLVIIFMGKKEPYTVLSLNIGKKEPRYEN